MNNETAEFSSLKSKSTTSVKEFWQYSLQFYSLKDNQQTLLWLQDYAKLNINTILLLMYLQTKRVFISANEFNILTKKNESLDSLTSNLREKRMALKAKIIPSKMRGTHALDYQEFLKQELELEAQQQACLLNALDRLGQHNAPRFNLDNHDQMDIKSYLLATIRTSNEEYLSEAGGCIDALIHEQIEQAKIFGQHLDD